MKGIWTIIVKEPYSSVVFKAGGGEGTPAPPPGSVYGSIMSVKVL